MTSADTGETAPATSSAPAARTGSLFTIPPGKPFLDCLAAAILAGDLPRRGGRAPDPLDLPAITLLLPTNRAARALQESFLRLSGERALLLPRIRPISEAQEDVSLLTALASPEAGLSGGLGVPPAIGEMERRLVLMELVQRWSQVMRTGGDPSAPVLAAGSNTPAQAAQLARELSQLMDMVETESVSLTGLEAIVPDAFSQHWQQTLDFLKIVTEFWPLHLRERAHTSAADRRNRLILEEAERLRKAPPPGPVIVAGVTGSIPATAELMRAVAALPQGAIVLPALDTALDAAGWEAIVPAHPEHPQFGLGILLQRLGVTRSDVAVLPGAEPAPHIGERLALVSEAMRPSATTQTWHAYAAAADTDALSRALAGVTLIEAPTTSDEAETIALILREAAETPGRTAALVSPDRLLARRVANRLQACGIRVDDSAGRPLRKTVPGAFLDLAIEAAAQDFAPRDLMALLKHPLCRLGLGAFDIRKAARALEIAALRDDYLGRGLPGVKAALARAEGKRLDRKAPHQAARRLWDADWAAAHDLVARIEAAFAPLLAAYARDAAMPLRDLARAHVTTAEVLAQLPEGASGATLWEGEAGEAAARFFAAILDPSMPSPQVPAADYADLYRCLLAGENVRPSLPTHPRLSIWGPLEARLQQPDVVVLGSLNDGTWPDAADPGPWLNRPMRSELKLPSPEERIGHAAHDFVALLGAPRVVLTRALKVDGVPSVASRWLMRLKALLAGMGLGQALDAADPPWLAWARGRDAIGQRITIPAPEPRPALALRPRTLSVSDVERWIANPYAIFARKVLDLAPLPALGKEPDAALRGAIIHEALSRFATAHPVRLPADMERELVAIAQEILAGYAAHPRIAAFWAPRFARFARWFALTEPERRAGVRAVQAEVEGRQVLEMPKGAFTLRARADRIDTHDAGLVITDYKTGAPPRDPQVLSGLAPQLPLEAAIAIAGGFVGLPAAPVLELRYIRASGGEPPGEERSVKASDVGQLAESARQGLIQLVARFDDEATPYRATRRARFSYDYDDYAHLARVAEWSGQGDGEGEDAA